MTFVARYDDVCAANCDMRIHPGDHVRYVDDQLVHVGCFPAEDEPEREPRPVCRDCFTEIALNGSCSCP